MEPSSAALKTAWLRRINSWLLSMNLSFCMQYSWIKAESISGTKFMFDKCTYPGCAASKMYKAFISARSMFGTMVGPSLHSLTSDVSCLLTTLSSGSLSSIFTPSCTFMLFLMIMWSASVFHAWRSRWGRESPSKPLPAWMTSTSGLSRQHFSKSWASWLMFSSMSSLKILKNDTKSSAKFKYTFSESSIL